MSPTGQEVHVDVEGRTLKISNLNKVLYPRTGTTKGEVLSYYAQIAPVMLPHLQDRPVTRIRWPHGVEGNSFLDRKSTRLNSSHANISYAVFCLKKKNRT